MRYIKRGVNVVSKISNAVASNKEPKDLRVDEIETNFMGGDSYKVSPYNTMCMVTASSIFGEPKYYINSKMSGHGMTRSEAYRTSEYIQNHSIIPERYEGMSTESMMEAVIDAALDYDFGATIRWAARLRSEYFMRLNPQVIMVRAAMHPRREEFTSANPGVFNEVNQLVMRRGDDAMSQMAYYMFKNKGKNDIPSIIKRSWARNISNMGRYAANKYKSHEIGLINAVRICHAKSAVVSELMKTGKLEVSEEQETWERMRSSGSSWLEIFKSEQMGHMAMLRNIRNFATEVEALQGGITLIDQYIDRLISGVKKGKQFPFRYYRAYIELGKSSALRSETISAIMHGLDKCMTESINNMPRIKGKTMCLSDNSGSAWDGFTSEYGRTLVAEIDNISAVITAMCSEQGYVGKFGDTLRVYQISKHRGVLEQAAEISADKGRGVGASTEGGIWDFFDRAYTTKEHWDNIFIYSDQQAGHGGLYGTPEQQRKYRGLGYGCSDGRYINVFKLVLEYRQRCNKRVNVLSIQTAGYDNVVIPEYAYRTNLLYGWTGKEVQFASAIIEQWDALESNIKRA